MPKEVVLGASRLKLRGLGYNVGVVLLRIGFGGVPYYTCSIVYPQALF